MQQPQCDLFRGSLAPGHCGADVGDGDEGAALGHIELLAVGSEEAEGVALVVALPADGDKLAAAGIIALAAVLEIGHLVAAVDDVDIRGEHDDHIVVGLLFPGDAVHHLLAILPVDIAAEFLVIDKAAVLLALDVIGQGQVNLRGVLAVFRGAVGEETEEVILVRVGGHVDAVGQRLRLQSLAPGEEHMLPAEALGHPVFIPEGIVGGVPGVDVEAVQAVVPGVVQHIAGAAGVGGDQVIVHGQVIEHQPGAAHRADLGHKGGVSIQRQTPDDGIVDIHFHIDVRQAHADAGHGVGDIADGHGKDSLILRITGGHAGKRVGIRRLRGCLGGWLRLRLRHGNSRLRLRRQRAPGRNQLTAPQQQADYQQQNQKALFHFRSSPPEISRSTMHFTKAAPFTWADISRLKPDGLDSRKEILSPVGVGNLSTLNVAVLVAVRMNV